MLSTLFLGSASVQKLFYSEELDHPLDLDFWIVDHCSVNSTKRFFIEILIMIALLQTISEQHKQTRWHSAAVVVIWCPPCTLLLAQYQLWAPHKPLQEK